MYVRSLVRNEYLVDCDGEPEEAASAFKDFDFDEEDERLVFVDVDGTGAESEELNRFLRRSRLSD